MNEDARWTRALAALAVCLSMIAGMIFILPQNVAAAPPDGYIVGNVTDGTNPLPGSIVIAFPTFGGVEVVTWSDALGDYLLSVPGGLSYMVLAYNDSCYGDSSFASVVSGETVYVDLTLENIAPAVTDVTLTGFVWDDLGSPVSDAMIGAFTADPSSMGDGAPVYINMTRTDGAGMYVVDILPSIAGGGVVAIGIPGYPFVDNSTDEAFVSGQTYWVNLTLQPESYDDDASVSGTVTEYGTGLPIENVMVIVETWNETTEEGSSNMTWTAPDGSYNLDVKSGSARVVMSKTGYTMFMRDNFEVLPGEHAVVDAQLMVTDAIIRGNVTDADTGLPINNARVYILDMVNGTMNMAFTNATGAYALEAFEGSNLLFGAEADGYGWQRMFIDVDTGDELWIDIQLLAIDAMVYGTITDAFTGMPIEDAGVHFMSVGFENGDNSDASGAYEMELVSGDYAVEAFAMNYRNANFDVTIFPGSNTVDIQMMPWDVPDTVRMFGYVNDSSAGTGIDGARVHVGLGPPDYSESNMTNTDSSGYYEIYLPAIEMMVVVSAWEHTHAEAYVDASAAMEIRMDFVLDPDNMSPELTYLQTVTENVSWMNPTLMSATAQDLDIRSLGLWQFMKNGSGSGWSYYYTIEALYANLNPLEPSNNNLPYIQVDHTYYVDYMWTAEPMCGWMSDGVTEVYLPYYEVWMGPDMYSGLRGEYVNSSIGGPQQGTAWFSGASGEFTFFSFDDGWYQPAMPDDPTGVVTAYANSIQVLEGTDSWWWIGTIPVGDWSVVGLTFTPDWIAPSGDYASLFFAGDWADLGSANITLYTVDNDPPVADAGPGQEAIVGTEVTLYGNMSSDNSGIATYLWSFEDGAPVELYGETVNHTFATLGNHTVTLTVWDGAGHYDSAMTWVNVTADQGPTADAGPDQDVTVFDVVQFNGTKSWDDLGVDNYTWTIVELAENMWGPTPQYTFTAPGVYSVTLVVEDTIGQASAPDTMQVTVFDADVTPPVADAGEDQTRMAGELVTLNGSDSWDDVGIVNMTWTFWYDGGWVYLYGMEPQFTFWIEGVYDITLNVTDAAGNWDTDEVRITVSGFIPEFPSVMLPVTGILIVVLFVVLRKRRV